MKKKRRECVSVQTIRNTYKQISSPHRNDIFLTHLKYIDKMRVQKKERAQDFFHKSTWFWWYPSSNGGFKLQQSLPSCWFFSLCLFRTETSFLNCRLFVWLFNVHFIIQYTVCLIFIYWNDDDVDVGGGRWSSTNFFFSLYLRIYVMYETELSCL